MRVIEAKNFKRTLKKLRNNQKQHLDEAIKIVMDSPLIGVGKTADLLGLRVYKFPMVNQLTLLAYRYDEQSQILMLEAVGSHENFYRDLKK